MRLASVQKKLTAKTTHDDGDGDVDGPLELRVLLALREARAERDRRGDDDGLPAPEMDLRERVRREPRLHEALRRVVDAGEDHVADEREDDGVRVERTEAAVGEPRVDVGLPVGELQRDDDPDEHSHEAPSDGGNREPADRVVVVLDTSLGSMPPPAPARPLQSWCAVSAWLRARLVSRVTVARRPRPSAGGRAGPPGRSPAAGRRRRRGHTDPSSRMRLTKTCRTQDLHARLLSARAMVVATMVDSELAGMRTAQTSGRCHAQEDERNRDRVVGERDPQIAADDPGERARGGERQTNGQDSGRDEVEVCPGRLRRACRWPAYLSRRPSRRRKIVDAVADHERISSVVRSTHAALSSARHPPTARSGVDAHGASDLGDAS